MPKNFDLAVQYMEQVLPVPLSRATPIEVSGWELIEILWPLNQVFRRQIHKIRSLPYRPEFEPMADRAIEEFVFGSGEQAWAAYPGDVWRVLLERHQQLIAVGLANELADNRITVLPAELPASERLPVAMLLLLHSMELPWPPDDRSEFELPEGSPPVPLREQ